MTLHPDAQRKAQAELDAVIGLDTLPTMEDRSRLPYVNALVKEVFRWHPVAPLSSSPPLPIDVSVDIEYLHIFRCTTSSHV
jgi:cytochrome P450